MPVVANKLSTALQLKVKTGTDTSGNDIIATQTYRRVKVSSLDESLYEVAEVMGDMQSTPVVSIVKSDSYELVNQA